MNSSPAALTGDYLPPPVLSICPHPLQVSAQVSPAPAGMTVAEILYEQGYGYVLLPSCRASIVVERFDGTALELAKAEAFSFTPLPGDVVGVRVLPGKGGGGKNPLQSIVSVAFIVASMYVPGAWAMSWQLAMNSMGMTVSTAFASAMISGAIGLAGMAVGSFLASPPTNDIRSAGGSVFEADSTTYAITGSQNKINRYGVVPQLLGGTYRVYPCHGAEPYTEIVGEDQYLRQLFAMYGPVKVEDMRIGETPLSSYTDYEIEVREGWATDAPVTLYSNGQDVHQESVNLELKASTGWVTRRTNAMADEVIFDLALTRGLYVIDQRSGAKVAGTVQVEVQYCAVGAADWLPWPVIPSAYVMRGVWTFSQAYAPGDVVTWEGTTYRCIAAHTSASRAQATASTSTAGTWADTSLWVAGSVSTGTGILTISGKYTSAHYESFRAVLGGGQYDIRWRRVTPDNTDGYTYDLTNIIALRTITHRNPISSTSDLPPLCTIALRIKANGRFNGVIEQFNFLATAYLPVWNPATSAFVMQPSNVPAWAYVNVLRGPANKKPVADSLIDIPTMLEWAAFTEAKGLHINALVDVETTTRELGLKIARVGRASTTKRDNLYSVAIDNEKPVAVQVLTPRNSWGFEGTMQLPDQPHALRCQFNDASAGYQQNERIVYAPGYSEATASVFEELQLWGVTNADEAWRSGQFHMAQVRLRPEEFTAWMDIEHLRCRRGSRIRVVHDVVLLGLGQGRIKSVDYVHPETDRRATACTIDSTVPMEAGKSYAAGIRLSTGTLVTAAVATAAGESSRLVFASPILASASPQGRELLYFCEAGKEAEDMIITNIEKGDDFTARLTMRHYAPAVQQADTGVIPPFDSKMTRPIAVESAQPGTPVISSVVSDEPVLLTLADGTMIPRIVVSFAPTAGNAPTDRYQVQIRETAGAWRYAPDLDKSARAATIRDVEEGHAYDIRIRSVSANGATSGWATVLGHIVIGKTSPPSDVVGLSANDNGTNCTFMWTACQDVDFAGLELRYSPEVVAPDIFDWASAWPITKSTRGTLITNSALPPGRWTIGAKNVDTGGRYSLNAATCNVSMGNSNTIIAQAKQSPAWPGIATNMVRHHTGVLIPLSTKTAAELGLRVFTEFAPEPVAVCSYESPEIDLGTDVSAARLWATAKAVLGPGVTGSADPHLEVDYRTAGGAYGGWRPWSMGVVPARYVKMRVVMDPTTGAATLNEFTPTVDIEPKVMSFGPVAIPAGGGAVAFPEPFYAAPRVYPQALGGALYAVPSSITPAGCTVNVYNSAGASAGGTVTGEARLG